MKDNIFRISICPRCGQTYAAPPATARDGSGPICPDCGTREALESIGVGVAEQDKIIETIHNCARRAGYEH